MREASSRASVMPVSASTRPEEGGCPCSSAADLAPHPGASLDSPLLSLRFLLRPRPSHQYTQTSCPKPSALALALGPRPISLKSARPPPS